MVKLRTEPAPAKINLFLRVVGRRLDGYHELDSILLPVALFDEIAIELRNAAEASVTLKCNRSDLPTDDRNLAARAARTLMAEFGIRQEVSIALRKEIPLGAGLGGGSSDAAAVLRAMASMLHTTDEARLVKIALGLGADVPFFLNPRPARIGGIGERLAPLHGLPRLNLVITVPPIEVSTASIFAALDPKQWSGAAPEGEIQAILKGRLTAAILVNDLEVVATARHPEIANLKVILENTGARAVAMSGSGGAVFGIFGDPAEAEHAARKVRDKAPSARVFAVSTLDA